MAAALGFFGGPLAYLAGQKIGGIVLVEQTTALVALGLGWAVMMPLLTRLAGYFDGVSDKPIATFAAGSA